MKILDFGIARVKHVVTANAETLTIPETTRPGTIMCTIGYMSPEQVRGETADAPSDIFSLGCVLYEMVGGQRPFARATGAETIAAILKEEPPALTATGRGIPKGLELLVQGCLKKQPSARLQSAHDLAQNLKAIGDGRKTGHIPFGQPRSRWQRAAVIGAATILLLSLLAWLFLTGRREHAIDSLAVMQ